MTAFVRGHPDCFDRSCPPGHVTGSAWIVSADHRTVLLTLHRKLGRWLQLGGHADGDPDPLRVALREAREESGIEHFSVVGDGPLDVDVHEIPAYGRDAAHLHYDVRWLLVAPAGQAVRVSDESHALRWVAVGDLDAVLDETSLRRMARRARTLLTPPG